MNRVNACFTLLGIIGMTLAVVVCLFCCPASAETIALTYTDQASNTYETTSYSNSYGTPFNGFVFEDITRYAGLATVVMGTNWAPYAASGSISETTGLTFSIGAEVIGSGEMTATTIYTDSVASATVVCIEVSSWDVSGYSGQTYVAIDFDDDFYQGKVFGAGYTKEQTLAYYVDNDFFEDISDADGSCLSPGYYLSGYYYWSKYRYKITAYNDVDFLQTISYDDCGTYVDMTIDKNGYGNLINITDNDGLILYESSQTEDISGHYYGLPITVYVTNPFTTDVWSNQIPETTGPSSADPAEFTSYIYDAQTGHLISGASTTKTYDATSTSTSDPSGVVHDVVYWEDTTWASFTASATGYYNSTVEFNYTATPLILPDLLYAAPGSNNIQSFHLIPTSAPSNSTYALTFQIQQEISPNSGIFSRSVDATVSCDGIQHLTGPSGTTWYNVTAGSHAYTVSKNGFETVQGSVTVSTENLMETAYLHLSQSEPTPIGNETSGEVGDEDMHEAVAEAYAEFAAFIPEAVMIGCVLFLLSMFKKF